MNCCGELFGEYVGVVSGVAAHTPANSVAIDSCMLGFECARNLVIVFFMRSME